MRDFGQAPHRGEVFRRLGDYELEFLAGRWQAGEVEQGAAEGDPGRQVTRVPGQAFLTDPHRLFGLAGAAVLFGQLREGNGRRVTLDPAAQFVDTGRSHWVAYGVVVATPTLTTLVTTPMPLGWNVSSDTRNVTL